jgi:hypothetical protein
MLRELSSLDAEPLVKGDKGKVGMPRSCWGRRRGANIHNRTFGLDFH